MVEHNIGAQDPETYVLKRVDEDFFGKASERGRPGSRHGPAQPGPSVVADRRVVGAQLVDVFHLAASHLGV